MIKKDRPRKDNTERMLKNAHCNVNKRNSETKDTGKGKTRKRCVCNRCQYCRRGKDNGRKRE